MHPWVQKGESVEKVMEQRVNGCTSQGAKAPATATATSDDSDSDKEAVKVVSTIDHAKSKETGGFTRIDVRSQPHVTSRLDFTAKNNTIADTRHQLDKEKYEKQVERAMTLK